MSHRTLKLFAAAAMALVTPSSANAQTVAYGTSSPIVIASYSIDGSSALKTMLEAAEPPHSIAPLDDGYIALTFVNKATCRQRR